MGEDTRQAYYRHLESTKGKGWSQLRSRIEDAHEQINNRGFCLVDGEWMKTVRGVATPLQIGHDGSTLALSCGAPEFAVSIEQLENELRPRLVHVTQQLKMLLRDWGQMITPEQP